MLIRVKMLMVLASLLALTAFGGCVAETGDIEGNAQGGDRTEVNIGSLSVEMSSDVDLPEHVSADDFDVVLIADDGEVVNATFIEEDGNFVLVLDELDSEKSWTLEVTPPGDVEIDRPTQEVTIVAGEMKNVDINIINVMVTGLNVELNTGDVELPAEIGPDDFGCELEADDGETLTAEFDANFSLVVEDLNPEKDWTLSVEAPAGIEIDQPTQDVEIVAGEMTNVDINITNVMVD